MFVYLILRLNELIRRGRGKSTGLPPNHPIRRFFANPASLDAVLALDDTVFWGALPLMREAKDKLVSSRASQFLKREVMKCVDVRRKIEAKFPVRPGMSSADLQERDAQIELQIKEVI
jgi:uncharacterized protein